MNSTKAFLVTKGDVVRYASDQLTGSLVNSPWTMTIIPGKSVGYFVHIATGTASDEAVESMYNFSKEFSNTSIKNITPGG